MIISNSLDDGLNLWSLVKHTYFSCDTSTHNVAMVSGFVGVNTFPKGVKITPERLERPLKYEYTEHAERNAIFTCAKYGIPTADRTMYVLWYACPDCARAIICAGIKRVVGLKSLYERTPPRWKGRVDIGISMLNEAGVECVLYDGILNTELLFNGEKINI